MRSPSSCEQQRRYSAIVDGIDMIFFFQELLLQERQGFESATGGAGVGSD